MSGDFPRKSTIYALVWPKHGRHTQCIYSILGWEITKYTVIYGLHTYGSGQPHKCALMSSRVWEGGALVSCVGKGCALMLSRVWEGGAR